ncbi:putative transcriptional regulator [Pseudobdellovibrio exovorus JSS]|uniref:Putative transcriptional regulator n=1 Tax=Pseudobdellovibrio exovorus JSS TaxID=1184267 RepID=M4VD47_9BACT|nr:putative transcriptional regulator [Pseudobdellovibrio exovorus JSS]
MSQKKTVVRLNDRAASEERLLNAAEELFSKIGYDRATTREIAKKSDVNIALINRYFDGKQGLLIALLKRKMERFKIEQLSYPEEATVTKEAVSYCASKIHGVCQDLSFVKIIFVQLLVDPKFSKKFKEQLTFSQKVNPLFLERMEKFRKAGKLKSSRTTEEICEPLELYAFSCVLFKIIMDNEPKDVVLKNLKNFVEDYIYRFDADRHKS